MEKETVVRFNNGDCRRRTEVEINGIREKEKMAMKRKSKRIEKCRRLCLEAFILIAAIYSILSIWSLKAEVEILNKKMAIMKMAADDNVWLLENLEYMFSMNMRETKRESENVEDDESAKRVILSQGGEEEVGSDSETAEETNGNENESFKTKRDIRQYEMPANEERKATGNETESTGNERSENNSTFDNSSELTSSERFAVASTQGIPRNHQQRGKHGRSRFGSSERFFTETQSTTSFPIRVRQSRTKSTRVNEIEGKFWPRNQMAHHRDSVANEESIPTRRRYGGEEDEGGNDSEDLSYNMITVHFSADTSHYSRERDPHYFGNGRIKIKSEVYKDWKPAHWTHGVGMSKYFRLHQGRVTISTTGIYLIYAQIQYSNVQEVNGFSIFRNSEIVSQCIKSSSHPDRQEIKSNTCGISTTILLQSNDSVCIKDLHHGRNVVLTPEKSYFGLVLLSPFKN